MKYLIILADGLADEPMPELDNQTVVMAAHTPNIDELCRRSVCGMLKTVPDSLHPGSEVANMSIMGFDAEKCYQGRGVLEAAAMGIDILPGDLVMRCNLVCVSGNHLVNHSGGHISTHEAGLLIDALNESMGDDTVQFHKGVSYRHVLVVKGGLTGIDFTPPHDVPGALIADVMPRCHNNNPTFKLITALMQESRRILENHPVNLARKANGKYPANMIWPWSAGYKPDMPLLSSMYGFSSGVVISAVDLIHGIGRLGGLKSLFVEGATGLYDTNYRGKTQAALSALENNDFVVFCTLKHPMRQATKAIIDLKYEPSRILINWLWLRYSIIWRKAMMILQWLFCPIILHRAGLKRIPVRLFLL
jgi:phosphoglycerate mutase (EC 5.4.2.1)